jgi:hypothetical protein
MTSWRCPDEVGDCHASQAAYRGSAAAGGEAIIAGPWSEFQRPPELPLSRVRSGRRWGIIAGPWSEFQRPPELPLSRVRSSRRRGDYRGSVERISASARAAVIADRQRGHAGVLSRLRGANFSVGRRTVEDTVDSGQRACTGCGIASRTVVAGSGRSGGPLHVGERGGGGAERPITVPVAGWVEASFAGRMFVVAFP